MVGRVDASRPHGFDSESRVRSPHLGEGKLRLPLDTRKYRRSTAGRSRGPHARDEDEAKGLASGCEINEGAGAGQRVVACDLDVLAEGPSAVS